MFGLIAAKLRRPPVRPGAIRRSSLIEKLARETSPPVVSVVAPAGYGKTTLLAQWADDPKVFLSYVAKALDAVEAIGERVFGALAYCWRIVQTG